MKRKIKKQGSVEKLLEDHLPELEENTTKNNEESTNQKKRNKKMSEQKHSQFAVLGLGRFGMSIVKTLADYDVNILACDKEPSRLAEATGYATHVVQVDVGDETAVSNLALGSFDVVILAMGEELESSIMATMLAKEQGAKFVMAKAKGKRQEKILKSVGADQVVLPEHEMGAKIARNLVDPNILDILEDSELYTITEMTPMEEWIGKSIRQADIRRKHNHMILAMRQGEKLIIPVSPDRVLGKEDILIVLSERKRKEKNNGQTPQPKPAVD